MRLSLFALAALMAARPAFGAPVHTDHVDAELVSENQAFVRGADNWVALRLAPDSGWHTYWRNPGDSGLPTRLAWTLPAGVTAGDIQWPFPEIHELGGLVNYGYGSETLHLVPVRVPADWPLDRPLHLAAEAKWLACSDLCIPGSAKLTLTAPVSDGPAEPDLNWRAKFDAARARLPRTPALPGRFQIEGGEFRLAVDTDALADGLSGVRRVEFFPYAGDLVNHSAPQRSRLDGPGARFAQPLSQKFVKGPATVAGVLVAHGAPDRAYEISARPGIVAPVIATNAGATRTALPLQWLLAFLGGLILNLMPCVFPVLSIKAIALVETRGLARAAQRRHALAYTAGVLTAFVGAAATLLLLRTGGRALGWGFQLQSPAFVAVLAYLLLALGLSLSGVVQFGTRLMGIGQPLTEAPGAAGSFFTGALAVVVASPCTAPFMGPALGYALTQPPAVSLSVFAALGLGLAAPFLLIGFWPPLGAWLPRPGPWMVTFKQAMAFPLYLTVVWLLWVLMRQTSADAAALVMIGLVLIAFALWLWGRPEARTRAGRFGRNALRYAAAAAAAALLAHPLLSAVPAKAAAQAAADWEPYSDARLDELRAQGRTVFVNITADWCLSCKVNERMTLDNPRVREAFRAHRVVYLIGDWTKPDPAITRVLQRFGRDGVPLYLLYPRGGEARVLPQILTPGRMLEALSTTDAAPPVAAGNY